MFLTLMMHIILTYVIVWETCHFVEYILVSYNSGSLGWYLLGYHSI